MQSYIGQILAVAFDYAPKGWFLCQGQLLPIQQYTALFSLLGTYYGGDGRTTFALPDLRGRAPLGMGQGIGWTPRTIGEGGGSETVTLTTANLPAHSHAVACNGDETDAATPVNNFPGAGSNYSATPNATMSSAMIQSTGGNQPHENRPPFQVQNWIICWAGIFPPRS